MLEQTGEDRVAGGGASQPGNNILHGEGAEVQITVSDYTPWESSDCLRL